MAMARRYSSSSSSTSLSEDEEIVRRHKVYRERINYFEEYDDIEFFDRFPLSKPTFSSLLNEIQHEIKLPTNRGGCIQPIIQLLFTLRFLASGSMLIAVGDFVGVSKSSSSRIVKRVCDAISRLNQRYIQMCNRNEMEEVALDFYIITSFPRTIGAIDCSGYRIEKYLMTKLEQANTGAENLYNESLIRTRNVVEREYGVWKRRFPILSLGIRLDVDTAMTVIVATAVLHRMAIAMNEKIPPNWMANNNDEVPRNHEQQYDEVNGNPTVRQFRQLLINEHFSRL